MGTGTIAPARTRNPGCASRQELGPKRSLVAAHPRFLAGDGSPLEALPEDPDEPPCRSRVLMRFGFTRVKKNRSTFDHVSRAKLDSSAVD